MAFQSLLAAVLCVYLLSSRISVNADTPANCTYEEIRGTWLFSIGEGGHDNTIKCSEFKAVSELQVQLLFPDVAVDREGNVGFWTLIYNQGFEVQINGKVYFAFSAYEKSGKEVVSYCDRTLNGWSHDIAEYKPGNWACYSGMFIIPSNRIYYKCLLQSDISIDVIDRGLFACTVFSRGGGGGGGEGRGGEYARAGYPVNKLCRYVRPQRVWFLAILVRNRVSTLALLVSVFALFLNWVCSFQKTHEKRLLFHYIKGRSEINKLTSVFHASVLLLIMNCGITLSK